MECSSSSNSSSSSSSSIVISSSSCSMIIIIIVIIIVINASISVTILIEHFKAARHILHGTLFAKYLCGSLCEKWNRTIEFDLASPYNLKEHVHGEVLVIKVSKVCKVKLSK